MDPDLTYAADPAGFADGVRAVLDEHPLTHHHEGGMSSERHATHSGHEIMIRTSYEVTVDGRPFTGHVFVSNDGQLRTHALPNYTFVSAIDMVVGIIDRFPADFRLDGAETGDGPHHGHGG